MASRSGTCRDHQIVGKIRIGKNHDQGESTCHEFNQHEEFGVCKPVLLEGIRTEESQKKTTWGEVENYKRNEKEGWLLKEMKRRGTMIEKEHLT